MKRHRAWWIVLALLLVAWVPFGVEELVHKAVGLNYYPDREVGLMFGVWLFIWWPCHIIAAMIALYKLFQWAFKSRSVRKA
jgi:hypothetical protein